MRVIPILQIHIRDRPRAAGAFGYVLAGHFEMDAARIGAFSMMHVEEGLHLGKHHVERTRLVARHRLYRVAMHRIAGPHNRPPLALHRAHERRKMRLRLVRTEARDQSQPTRLVFRIENVDQSDQIIRRQRRTAFEADRIADAPAIFEVSMVRLTRAVTNPDHMARRCVPVTGRRIDARHRLLITKQQRLM